jgi:co-chaperonin GroES (HSP10)
MSVGVTFAASTDILPGGTKLRMLRDRLLLRPLDWEPSTIITVIRSGRPLRGEVVAVGPGRLYRRYKPHPTDSRKRTYVESKTFIPTQVKVGDIVELGGLNAYDGAGYSFPQVTIGTETFVIVQEQDVCFIREAA